MKDILNNLELMNKKKIIFVTLSYAGGGAEKIFTRLLENLHENFNIISVTFTSDGIYYDKIKNLPIKKYVLRKKINNTILYACRLRKIIKKEQPYKVISFLYYPNIIVFLASIFLKVNLILCERSNHRIYFKNTIKHKIWKFLLKQSYKKSQFVISVSNKIKQFITEDFKITEKKIKVIYNGINFDQLDKFSSIENKTFFDDKIINIISVGRITEAKNYPLLINSFALLTKKYSNIHLHIVGDGELKNKIQDLIKEKQLEDKITLWGFVKNPYPLMKKADCFVLSSKWEGFPNVLLEALYLNGHIVSTDCDTGPAEIITHEYDGLLSPIDEPVKLAKNIERMIFDKSLREKVFNNSRFTIKKFDEKNMIENFKKILE